MSLTKCNRCHRTSTSEIEGANCLKWDAFHTHPCMGTMRRTTAAQALRVWHLVNHMRVWQTHLERLRDVYMKESQMGDANAPTRYHEVKSDLKKLIEWRERLDAIDPRRDRKDNVSVLQGDNGDRVQEPKRQSINDPPVS